MKIEYNTLTTIIICLGIAAAVLVIGLDAIRGDEPIINNGDDFAGWELRDEDLNKN